MSLPIVVRAYYRVVIWSARLHPQPQGAARDVALECSSRLRCKLGGRLRKMQDRSAFRSATETRRARIIQRGL